MLSVEELKLLIEKLEKAKKEDLQELIDSNLKILKDIAESVDIVHRETIDRTDKTLAWFNHDRKTKLAKPFLDAGLTHMITQKIYQFGKTNMYKSLEIGPGNGDFSKSFGAWAGNYFLDITWGVEPTIRKMFPRLHQKYLTFYKTSKHECSNIPQNSCNFIFSWDTFVFFEQDHIRHYLQDIKRILIPGGYVFIQYADCHYDRDLSLAKRGYWNFNNKSIMSKIIEKEGYQIVEMNGFRPGANYAIFRKPGKQNPVDYKVFDLDLD